MCPPPPPLAFAHRIVSISTYIVYLSMLVIASCCFQLTFTHEIRIVSPLLSREQQRLILRKDLKPLLPLSLPPSIPSLLQALEQQPFIDNHWLLYNGPLRLDTVLEYFSLSKFYDRRSCNEELRMQGAEDIRLEDLEMMRGLQYLAEEVPGLKPEDPIFVIKKVRGGRRVGRESKVCL